MNEELTFSMNKMAIAALGLGAAYLMRNRDARGKLMKQFESFTGSLNMKNGLAEQFVKRPKKSAYH